MSDISRRRRPRRPLLHLEVSAREAVILIALVRAPSWREFLLVAAFSLGGGRSTPPAAGKGIGEGGVDEAERRAHR